MKPINRLLLIGLLVGTFVLLHHFAAADVTVRGTVLRNGATGMPIQNISVSSAGEANATETDSRGFFELRFPRKDPGDKITLTITSPDLVVVNPLDLVQIVPKSSGTDPITVILSTQEEREECSRIYYSQIGRVTFQRTAESRIAATKTNNTPGGPSMAEVFLYPERWLSISEEVAKLLSKYTPDEPIDTYLAAVDILKHGKLDPIKERALKMAALQDLQASKTNNDAKMGQYRGAINRFRIIAQILLLQGHFSEAREFYEKGRSTEPESFECAYDYAMFFYRIGDFSQMTSPLQLCDAIAGASGNHEQKMKTLGGWGLKKMAEKDYAGAISDLDGALQIARERVSGVSRTFNDEYVLSQILNNCANANSNIGGLDRARSQHDEAYNIRQHLNNLMSGVYDLDIALTLLNRGITLLAQEKVDLCEADLTNALNGFQRLAGTNVFQYRYELATAENTIAVFYSRIGETNKAIDLGERSIRDWRTLVTFSPSAYSRDLAKALYNTALLLHDENMTLEALDIFGKLVDQFPGRYYYELGTIWNGLGLARDANNDRKGARLAHESARAVFKKANATNSIEWLSGMASTANNLAALDYEEKNYDAAVNGYLEAGHLYEIAARSNYLQFSNSMLRVAHNAAQAYISSGKCNDAEAQYSKALEIIAEIKRQGGKVSQGLEANVAQLSEDLKACKQQ